MLNLWANLLTFDSGTKLELLYGMNGNQDFHKLLVNSHFARFKSAEKNGTLKSHSAEEKVSNT